MEIDGVVMSDAGQMGMRYQFVLQGDAHSTTLGAVEELVLEHYRHHGYPDGNCVFITAGEKSYHNINYFSLFKFWMNS